MFYRNVSYLTFIFPFVDHRRLYSICAKLVIKLIRPEIITIVMVPLSKGVAEKTANIVYACWLGGGEATSRPSSHSSFQDYEWKSKQQIVSCTLHMRNILLTLYYDYLGFLNLLLPKWLYKITSD